MSLQNPALAALRDARHEIFQLFPRIVFAEHRRGRALRVHLLKGAVLEREPEQALIDALVYGLMKALIKFHQPVPVIVAVRGADDAVPVEIRSPLRVIHPEARGYAVIARGIPDQICGAPLLEFVQFHAKIRPASRLSGSRAATRSLTRVCS